jgi:hypothetical protein
LNNDARRGLDVKRDGFNTQDVLGWLAHELFLLILISREVEALAVENGECLCLTRVEGTDWAVEAEL